MRKSFFALAAMTAMISIAMPGNAQTTPQVNLTWSNSSCTATTPCTAQVYRTTIATGANCPATGDPSYAELTATSPQATVAGTYSDATVALGNNYCWYLTNSFVTGVTTPSLPSPTFQLAVAATLTGLSITPAQATIILGTSQRFAATCTWSTGPATDCTTTAAWSAAPTIGATVSNLGLASAAPPQFTTINATLNGITASATLRSIPPQFGQYIANSYTSTTASTLTFTCAGGELVVLSLSNPASGYSALTWSATNGNSITPDYTAYAPGLAAFAHIGSCVAGPVTVTVNVTGSGGTSVLQASRYN